MIGWKIALAWDPDPSVIVGCAALLLLYAIACRRDFTRAAWFVAGDLVMLLALISPLDVLADEYLFSAHMAQHMLLVLTVPPLLIAGIPRALARSVVNTRPLGPIERTLRNPIVAWTVGVVTLCLWHVPSLYDAAIANEELHIFEHLTFLVSATIFWWPLLTPLEDSRIRIAPAFAYLGAAALATGLLGIWITFAPLGTYSSYLNPPDRIGILHTLRDTWGMNAEADQQLGGLLMWVAGGIVYLGAILVVLARWYREPEADGGARIAVEVSHGG